MVLPVCRRGNRSGCAGATGETGGSAVGAEDLRRMGNVLADALELLAQCDERYQVRRLQHPRLERLAAKRLSERRPCGKSSGAKTKQRTGCPCIWERGHAAYAI